MLKDLQIANRLGLSNHLELGVSSAARDRLLEQLQRGHGDDDYSVVVRKYLPEGQPAGHEEADLELFDSRTPEAAPSPDVFAPNEDQSGGVETSFPEGPVPTLQGDLQPAQSSLGPMPPPESTAEPVEHGNAQTVSLETTATLAPEEAEEEPQEHRGFFGRLLRRGNEY